MRWSEIKEGTRCWKGYKRKGFKTMFGKRVPNCVKNEDVQVGADGELVFAEDLDENLKKWFKDKWVRFGPDEKLEVIVQEVVVKKVNLNAFHEVKHTH